MTCFVQDLICKDMKQKIFASDKLQPERMKGFWSWSEIQFRWYLSDLSVTTSLFPLTEVVKIKTTNYSQTIGSLVPLNESDIRFSCLKQTQFKLPVLGVTPCFSARVGSLWRMRGSIQSWNICQASLWNRRSKHLHGLQNERQMIQEWIHRHSEDPSFICTPFPETHEEKVQQQTSTLWLSEKGGGELKPCFLTQTACCQTLWAVCGCRLSSALGPETASAERSRPHETTGRERPESCTRVKEPIKHIYSMFL